MTLRTAEQISLEVKAAIETSRQKFEQSVADGGGTVDTRVAVQTLAEENLILTQAVMDLATHVANLSR